MRRVSGVFLSFVGVCAMVFMMNVSARASSAAPGQESSEDISAVSGQDSSETSADSSEQSSEETGKGPSVRPSDEKIRVGWYPMENAQEYDDAGNPQGLSERYLQEISKYTGYEFEYVDGSFDQCMKWLESGDIDMLFFVRYKAERASQFHYMDIPICEADSVIVCRKENVKSYKDTGSLDGKTIAVTGGASQKDELQKLTSKTGISYKLLELGSSDEVRKAVKDGKADYGILLSINSIDDDLEAVEQFEPRTEYIAVSNRKGYLLNSLNSALLDIVETTPDFRKETFSEYYGRSAGQLFILNRREKNAIEKAGELTFCFTDDSGYMSRVNKDGEVEGIQADVAEEIADKLGVKCRITATDRQSMSYDNPQADFYGGVTYDYTWADKKNIKMTEPFMTYNYCVISSINGIPDQKKARIAAMNKGVYFTDTYVTKHYTSDQIEYEDNALECIDKVRKGDCDATFLNTYIAQYYLREYKYQNLTYSQVNSGTKACFAAAEGIDPDLLSAVNKAIDSISTSDINSIIVRNTAKPGESDLKDELIYHYPLSIPLCLILIIGAVVCAVFAAKMKVQNTAVEAANREAEKANNAKTFFLSNMSHDMRTPMNAIIGMTYLAQDTADDPTTVRKYLKKIGESGRFLLSLINDILDMSKIENGSMELDPVPYDICEFTEQMRTLIEPQCIKKNIDFEIDCSDAAAKWIYADKVRVSQIFFNLLSNSVKFTPEGGKIILRIAGSAEEGDNIRCRFDVIDNGCGMTQEFQQKMFDIFTQSKKDDERGTGLGLAIVKKLVDLMHGTIKVDSAPGKGTDFHIEILVKRSDAEERANEESEVKSVIKDLKGVKILLFEDNQINREIAEALLEKDGMIVVSAENGKIGTDIFMHSNIWEYDAILMDVRMPVMDGIEATRLIRSQGREDAKDIPIIAMTANAFEEDIKATSDAGMNAHLSKPVEPQKLYETIGSLVAMHRAQGL